ncbi:CaiB/BaiF CoA-transferase family protein [Roseomonas sp. CECT 9278]|uniref:CaiB/BaiF CoA transferase family protein n=1 Tax=Roseomonas sp. CECT 9278 TaxID=2845823 RepID=UPI001E53FB11|nr:CoA transferase [Roseomonas sp. CECT 9278]CAH0157575.1 Acetyl-CoA:oxalate CoA-transferase [Roseomonas sp. CECT 9278]
MAGPLDGVRVLDLSAVVVGPICTHALCEQGAEVIKVEAPPTGDLLRTLAGKGRSAGMNGKFLNFNRGKKSIAIDLKKPAGMAALKRLAATVDVFVTNIRPDAQARLGVDAVALRALAPRLIHCSITGFGSGGPYAGRAAYDTVIQGASGVAGTFAASTGEPRYVPFLVADHTVGLIAAQLIGFALYRREKTGVGEAIEVPMFENMAAYIMQEHLGAASFRPPLGPPGDHRVLSPDGKPLPTKDGFVCISANTDAQAHAFFDAIGRPELKADPRFAKVAQRVQHTKEYFHIRATSLGGRTTAEWLDIFDRMDVPASPYNTLASLPDDPHLRAVGMVREEDHPTEGATIAIGAPNRFSGGNAPPRPPAPRLGADGAAVLAEAGLTTQDIDALRHDGVLIEGTP